MTEGSIRGRVRGKWGRGWLNGGVVLDGHLSLPPQAGSATSWRTHIPVLSPAPPDPPRTTPLHSAQHRSILHNIAPHHTTSATPPQTHSPIPSPSPHPLPHETPSPPPTFPLPPSPPGPGISLPAALPPRPPAAAGSPGASPPTQHHTPPPLWPTPSPWPTLVRASPVPPSVRRTPGGPSLGRNRGRSRNRQGGGCARGGAPP